MQALKNFIKSHPHIAFIPRFLYKRTFRAIGWIRHTIIPSNINGFCSINEYLPNRYKYKESFGGYYDKALVNGDYVIVNIANTPTKNEPSPYIPIKLLVIKLSNKSVVFERDVYSYNWQQGCRAHWIGQSTILYNNYAIESKEYYSEIFDVSKSEVIKQYSMPVQDSYKDVFLLSINYERLNVLRPDYGYRNKPKLKIEELENLDMDGIWYVDMKTGEKRMIISLAQIKYFGNDPISIAEKIHKANHVMISPNGEQIVFIHRFYPDGKRYDRLILADINGNMQRVLSTGFVSHYCWLDSRHLFGYFNNEKGKACYNDIDVISGVMTEFTFPRYTSSGDGHPSCNCNYIITDSYADKYGFQHLVSYDRKICKIKEIAKFYHPHKYSSQSRCDLHPRLSNENIITLDSVDNGIRQMYISLNK